MHLYAEKWKGMGLLTDDMLKATPKDLKALPKWKPLADIIKNAETEYATAKMTCHAANYGMEANTFQIQALVKSEGKLVLPHGECCRLLEVYHKLFPEIRRWHKRVEDTIRKTHTLVNMFGYPRTFYGHPDSILKEAYAFSPQSTVGTITNIAFTEMQQRIEADRLPYDLLNNKHDSILLQCPVEEKDKARAMLEAAMQKPLVGYGGAIFNMKTEASWGFNWGKQSKDNPNGLRDF